MDGIYFAVVSFRYCTDYVCRYCPPCIRDTTTISKHRRLPTYLPTYLSITKSTYLPLSQSLSRFV